MIKIPCTNCGTLILPITAEASDGLCMPCSKGLVSVCSKCGGRAIKTLLTESRPDLCISCFKDLRIEKKALCLDEIASIKDSKEGCDELDVWIWDNSLEDEQFDDNPQAIKEYIALWWMDGEVHNGGFKQFLSNYTGRYMPDALSALNKIGAHEIETIIKEIMTLFGSGSYPMDDLMRNDIMEAFDENTNQKLEGFSSEFCQKSEGIWALLFIYFKNHKEEYVINI